MIDWLPRALLPLLWLGLMGLITFGRSWWLWKQTGINPYKVKNASPMQTYTLSIFRFIVAASAIVVAITAFFPQVSEILGQLAWLEHAWVAGIGLGLIAVSTAWVVIAQTQMGHTWRVGFDEREKPILVKYGIFSISRNPIFLGIRIMMLGFFLLIPNAVTLVLLALCEVSLQMQVRQEEKYLQHHLGEEYKAYLRRVRRWL